MDPFSKTSFDALLESLVEIETGTSTAEPVLSDGRPDAFPGFPGLGTAGPQVMQMAQQEVATHQALYAQIMQQQQRLESVAQEFSRFQQPTVLAASTSAPTSPLASMHQRAASPAVPQHSQLGASIAARSGSAMRLSLDGRTLMNSAGLNSNSMAGAGPMQFSAPAPGFGADPAYLSDGQLPSQRLGNASKPLSPSDSESLPSPFPRASLQNLGVVSSHSDDFHVGGIDVHAASGSDRRREKNRIAQRRFRERQKTTVAMLQTELDGKEVELQRMHTQLRNLEQANQAMQAKLLQYEKAFGTLPG